MKRKAFSCAVLSMATALLIPGISLASPANTIGQWFNRSGKWYYGKDEDNLRKEWIVSDGDWYYLRKDSGELQSGWLSLNGKKYFLNTLHNGQFGKLLTGWQWIDGYCYFFEAEDSKTLGELKVSGSKDGYQLDENGRYLLNGTVVYEAGKGLPGTESGQSVAGVSRSLPSASTDSSYRSRSRRSSSDSQIQPPKEETKPEQPKEETKPEQPKTEEKKNSLVDGIYFGTSKEGIHFQEKGANIVKVRIENGKIASAESVVFTDDTQPDFFAKFRDRLLERVRGLDSVDEVKKSVNSKSGKYYDGLAGATRTLRSHTSAVENALSQAKKKEGNKEFPFSYMEFVNRPNPSQSGKTLDLSDTRLKLHFPSGETKVVSPEEFTQYGISTSPAQGSPIKEGTKEILVHFLQKDMDIDLVSAIVPRAEIRKKYPTGIHVHYANGDSSTITLDKENFRYTIPAKGKIDHMHLMDGNKEVARSVYDAAANQWSFSLKDVPHEGFSSWGYELYTVKVDTSQDTSPIASFTLDTHLAKKEYHVGDALKIDDLIVEAVTEQGNNKIYQNWDLAKAAGFSISPENNTALNTVGENTITVRYQKDSVDLSQTFTVNVKDLANQVPAKVEIRTKAGELVKRYSFTEAQWEEKQGMLSYVQVPVPKKFETAWNNKEFTAKAFNKNGDELKVEINRKGLLFRIQFPDYTHDIAYQNAMLSLSFKFEENAPVEKEENEKANPEIPNPEKPKEENQLTDGIYYGTAKEGIHFQEKGANIVKVRIENGKIASAESVVFTDDTQPDFFAKFRDRLLERVRGLDSVDEVKKSVNSKSGKYYDGLAGATRTLRSHTSAVENALSQAKKKEGNKEFPFSYMEFVNRPNPSQSGKTLDLSDTRLKLHFPSGETKVVSPEEFTQYGISTSPAQGSPIKEGTKEILVHFLQKDMDIDLVSAIVPRAEIRKKYPTGIHVHYANGDSSTITLDKENFRYTIPAKGKIDHMHLMDGNKEVARSVYDAAANQWSFSLKDVPHEGFSSWGYELYTVKVDTSQDTSPIASFTLDTHLAKKEYHVGDALKIDDLIVEAVTEQGNNKIYQNWDLAKAAGFSISPENNTALNTVGENTITVRYQKDSVDLSQTFTVNVKDLANQVPAKVEIRTKAGELVKRYSFTQEEWEQSSGGIKRFNQSIPKKFQESWNAKEFIAKAYNKDGEELTTESTRRGIMFRVEFPNYSSGNFVGTGIFSLSFQFDENAPVEKEEPETPKPDTPKPDTKPENPKEETPKKDDKTSSSTIEKPEENNTTDESLEAVVPRHVEVYWRGEKIVDKDYSLEEVKKRKGQLIFKGVKVPAKMKGHNKREDFTVVIKNSKGEDLPYTELDAPYSKSHARIHIELKKRYPEWTPMRIDYVWSYEENPTENKPSTGDESSVDDLLPSHAEVFWHGEKLVEKNISKEQIQATKGRLTYDVSVPGKKKRNFISDYSVVVKNQKGNELPQNHTVLNTGKISSLMVNLKNPHPQWGKMNLTFIWKYEEETENTTPEDPKKEEESNPVEKPKEDTEPSYIKTFYGESKVVPFDYTVKVKVTWDSKAKKILKVEDNDTFSGSNSGFWDNVRRSSMPALTGKTRDTIDDIDAVAGCTFSRNALVEAVRKAIPEE
ncbi:bacterial Ig-like domain-containing protein [Oribacterium parvum]|uniref:bacterial Ig-like domain-containing protein n=1 Tax=Oribacterium parvum TaxID=1501329 RepID=UPI0028E79E88|nr:FMN-binding protein [Oribacterium parvum]